MHDRKVEVSGNRSVRDIGQHTVIGLEAISIDTLETASDSKIVEFVNCISLNAKVM